MSGPSIHKENNNFAIPFKELYRVSKGIGIVEFTPDKDGIYRRTQLIRTYHGDHFPVLSIAPLIDETSIIEERDDSLLIKTASGVKRLPLYKGSYLINLYGGFEPYSMSGILASIQKIRKGDIEDLPVEPDEFNKKIVFIGASAIGMEDLKPTSISTLTPGVLLHASIYGNILKEDFLRPLPDSITFLCIILMGIITYYLILNIRQFRLKVLFSLIPFTTYLLLSFITFKINLVIEMAAPLTSSLLSFLIGFTYLSLTEEREKRRIKDMLGQYVSPAVLSGVFEKKGDIILGEKGTKLELTIFFF